MTIHDTHKETKAMLSTSERMAAKLREAISTPPIQQSVIAGACGVTKQAVQGWLKTGRFDKKHLPTLAKVTNRSLEWWLDVEPSPGNRQQEGEQENDRLMALLNNWRMKASPRSREVIDQLAVLAQKNALREDDWTLIETLANRLRQTLPPP